MSEHGLREACWLQLSSGRGPAECQIAVAKLSDEIGRAATACGIATELQEAVAGDEKGTLLSALMKLDGIDAVRFARSYAGTIQWICPSSLRAGHKRKNWFVAVDLLDVPETGTRDALDPRDVSFETMKAGGAGGQHVNKTESAVRLTPLPTNIVVSCQAERSQHKNRDSAMKILRSRLFAYQAEREKEKMATITGEKSDIAWGHQIRSYVLQPYTIVKDHRTNVEMGDVSRVLDGDLDRFIDAYLHAQVAPREGD